MHKIEKTVYGFKLTFGGFIKVDEMKTWLEKSKKELEISRGKYHVFVDMRALKALPEDSQKVMNEGQILFKENGMIRSVVIVEKMVVKLQFRAIAQESGIYEWERYIDAGSERDWEMKGMNWLLKAVDPDKVLTTI